MADEQQIRERAYALWEKEGSPEGRALEFWERATLMEEAAAQPAPATAADSVSQDDKDVDVAMEDTFPASDPPAFTADVGAGRKGR